MHKMIVRSLLAAVAVALAGLAVAQERRQNTPGQFDFYVLSLSWSPSFCEQAGERGTPPQDQCGGARPYSFVVHGLWPQYERGFPEYCIVPAPRLDRNIVNAMLDLMPSPRLIYHEWDKHGVCSGLNQRAYFETVRKARAVVKIPESYVEPQQILTVTPDEVEESFVAANGGMSRGGIAVTCDNRRLREVRVCFTKELGFRPCEQVDTRGVCRRDKIVMPPVRQRRDASVPNP
jgi:ribonuclease T2